MGRFEGTFTTEPTLVNGHPALLVRFGGAIVGVMAISVEGARITGLSYVRNPEKPAHLTSATPLALR
ncbi:hypothetical protein [Streptomyces sp. CB03234]|uniref:hypothetical protein n=1 Tax=Streptomyces sp. (strain CB03234) TaxID=1703937 RepID=UPI0018E90D50|nr:hypothetical protein [Streptomyces sp. CB03234]